MATMPKHVGRKQYKENTDCTIVRLLVLPEFWLDTRM